MTTSRRDFLKQSGLLMCATAVLPAQAVASKHPVRLAMIIDKNRCMGCQSCVVSCKAENDLAPHTFNTRIRQQEQVINNLPRPVYTPTQCQQCSDAPCVSACPAEATFALDNGVVAIDWQRCISCQSCVSACPYEARHADPRFDNKVDKCDFCLHRLNEGQVPACVENCASNARLFGDLNDPQGEFAEYLKQGDLYTDRPEFKLKTAIQYRPLPGERKGERA